jgi:hypothetical protein
MTARHALNVVRLMYVQNMDADEREAFEAAMQGQPSAADQVDLGERHARRVRTLQSWGGVVIEET